MPTNITIVIKNTEDISLTLKELLSNINNAFNILLDNFQLNSSIIMDELFKNCAGYILTEYIKLLIKNTSNTNLKRHFVFDKNKWYDFKYDNTPVKIITFEKDNYYSFDKLTSSQYNHRKDMIYISLVYSINNNLLTITDVLTSTADNIRIKYDKVIYNSIFPEDIEENEDDESGNNESGNNENNEYDPWEIYGN